MQRKTKLCVLIDEKVWEEFKKLALSKHNYKHGAISWELEEALRNWVATHTNAQSRCTNPDPRVYAVWREVREVLNEWGFFQQTTLANLTKAIALVRGNDPRTIRKWLRAFKQFKLVKELAPQIYEII